MYSDKENVNILTALLVRHGVGHVVVCPGSRNAPLVHNMNECPDITCHSVTDERSAGFVAIGLTQQLKSPVAICVTSGSALLNVLPAVAEATYQHTGIIVISADRPQAWIDQLDGQTLPQPDALGKFVGKSVNLPEPHDDLERWLCSRLVNEAMMEVKSGARPSVHINVPISEPLFDFTVESLPEVYAVRRKSVEEAGSEVTERLLKAERPLIVSGQLPEGTISEDVYGELEERFTVLSEPLSAGHQTFTDQVLYLIQKHPEEFYPDCVIFMGGHTVSKRLRQFLRSLPRDTWQMMVSEDGGLHDVSQHTRLVIEGDAGKVALMIAEAVRNADGASVAQRTYRKKWDECMNIIKDKHLSFVPRYSHTLAVKLFEESIKDATSVYYANSMSVRYGALFADHYCYCNRGVNGIEGSLSVAAGASVAQALTNPEGLTYCIIGDLSFFYDENALWQQELGGNLRILLLNNRQGGIFRNLKGLDKSAVRDTLISARHGVTAEGICQQFDIHYMCATDEQSLHVGIDLLHRLKSHRPVLLEVLTDVDEDEAVFKEYYRRLYN